MKILVIGGGAREHAIIKKLRESKSVSEITAAPGNGGISYDAACVDIKATDVEALAELAAKEAVDYAVVAQDDPLALALVDLLAGRGIPPFGPNAAAAEIESSKAFAKDLMKRYGIPTAAYEVFSDEGAAVAYIKRQNKYPVVIKADGLALGKGVIICEDEAAALEAVKTMLTDKKFGAAGERIVVEEFLTGPEVSVLAFTDGVTVKPMVSSMDHKRALDGDRGLNTGGMGAVAPNPFYTDEIAEQCMHTIFRPTVDAMRTLGRPFKGCLYFGLMLTEDGPRVIEYNCRFGDPETQVVLPLLKGDLLEIMLATTNGTLDETPVEFEGGACACVVLASGGYPEHYEKGKEITGLVNGELAAKDAFAYCAGVRRDGEKLLTSGGRVLSIVAKGDTLESALKKAYSAAETVSFEGVHKRTDIGARALAALG